MAATVFRMDCKPALGVREDEDTEAILAERCAELSRERKLEIVPGLFLPDREALVPEIDFEEGGVDPGWASANSTYPSGMSRSSGAIGS